MAGRTYRYFAGQPLYPFGYGLNYTQFRYGEARLAQSRITAGSAAQVEVTVSNAGQRDGEEVVQLYVSRDGEGAARQSLAGFQRVLLRAGESRTVTFDIAPSALGGVDAEGRRSVQAGEARIWVGGGQPGVAAERQAPGAGAVLTITGSRDLPAFGS